MIEVNKVFKKFNDVNNDLIVLNDLTFTINEGEIFGVMGPSGVGKSTLLKILNGLIKPDDGSILINNQLLDSQSKVPKTFFQATSFVFQTNTLLSNKNVFNNVILPLTSRLSKAEKLALVHEKLSFVGLASKIKSFPTTLSGGEIQRVLIARALINNPKIIFLDEPTSALDLNNTIQLLDLLKKINTTFGTTIVLVTHDLDVARYACNRVLWLEDGKILKLSHVKRLAKLKNDYKQVWRKLYV